MKKSYLIILISLSIACLKMEAQNSTNFFEGDRLVGFLPVLPGPRVISTYTTNYLPLSNYHFFNPYYHNPAMAGIDDKQQLNLDWNRQLNHSFLISYEQPISSINSAIGLQYSYTSNFYTSNRHFGLAYNYGFNLKDKAKLKLGLQFSQTSVSINESLFGLDDNKERWYNSPSLDLGLALKAKQVRIGVSVQNLFPTQIVSADSIINFYNIINGKRQFNTSIAYTFEISKNWDWSLATLIRSNNPNDFSSYLSFRKKYFIGATLRVNEEDSDSWINFIGIKIKEKMNLQLSFNAKKNEYEEDKRFFETLVQFQF